MLFVFLVLFEVGVDVYGVTKDSGSEMSLSVPNVRSGSRSKDKGVISGLSQVSRRMRSMLDSGEPLDPSVVRGPARLSRVFSARPNILSSESGHAVCLSRTCFLCGGGEPGRIICKKRAVSSAPCWDVERSSFTPEYPSLD